MARPKSLRRRLLGLASPSLVAGLVLCGSLAAQAARPDHVLWRNARGQVSTIVGTVKENTLTNVVVDTGSGQRKLGALDVERIDFGDVPEPYTEGLAYQERNDFENAAAKLSLAAGSSEARAVVRARARLLAAQAQLRRGADDPAAFGLALHECEQFLSEFPDNRDVPQARLLLGRAQRLSGDAAAAAQTYAELYREAGGAQPATGYPPRIGFQAGLAATEAYLALKDVTQARTIASGLDASIGAALAALAENDPLRAELDRLQSEARLCEGYSLLAAGSTSQAKTFFQGQIQGSESNAARRFGAKLGLGEALLAEGNARAAQIEFAQVSAIDHTSEDRVARALVGLAQTAIQLGAKDDARLWLDTVRTEHADTPAALKVAELTKQL